VNIVCMCVSSGARLNTATATFRAASLAVGPFVPL